MINIEESYEIFLNTLLRFDEKKLKLNDEELAYEIFEELDAEYHTFLHEWTVDRLINGNLIPKSIRKRILVLRENIRLVMAKNSTVEFYRNSTEWKKLRDEANSLVTELKTAANTT